MPTGEHISSLAPIFLIFSLLLIAALGWCILSSCLGVPLSRLFASHQETSLSSRPRTGVASGRRRKELGEDDGEIWEMEYRGRAG